MSKNLTMAQAVFAFSDNAGHRVLTGKPFSQSVWVKLEINDEKVYGWEQTRVRIKYDANYPEVVIKRLSPLTGYEAYKPYAKVLHMEFLESKRRLKISGKTHGGRGKKYVLRIDLE